MRAAARTTRRRLAWALLGALAAGACTEAGLQAVPPEAPPPLDDRLAVRGTYCTEPAAEVVFPVKVLFVLDQSASLQCTDSQNRRFGALGDLIKALRKQPNVSFGFIGFSSWSRVQGFTRKQADLDPFLDPAGGLGPATDYQGALATALRLLEEDMIAVGAAVRTRTRYVVVMVSDGVPEPRCQAGCEDDLDACGDGLDNDGDGLPDASDPDCAGVADATTHPDSLYGVCNTTQEVPDDVYVDYTGLCPAYNQPEQIMRRIDDLRLLQSLYSAGDVVLHTVLLFSPQAVVEGVCPGASAQFGYTHDTAKGLLQAMAQAGGGGFRDVNIAIQDEGFLQFDYASLQSEQWLTELVAFNLNARAGAGGAPALDTDADGLPDAVEQGLGTAVTARDSDAPKGDGYGDLLEHALRGSGLDPLDPGLPAVPCGDKKDFDGDRLLNCEEDVLGTDPRLPDTDDDGVLDWLELATGTDPARADGDRDVDLDGVPNRDEVRGGTDPTVPDEAAWREGRVRYAVSDLGVLDLAAGEGEEPEARHCYAFEARDLRLVTPTVAAARGRNQVLVYTLEKPFQLAGAQARAHVACVEALYDGPTSKVPEDGVIDVGDAVWEAARAGLAARLDAVRACAAGDAEAALDRTGLVALSARCLPPKVQLGRILYARAELEALAEATFREDLTAKLPARGADVFVPLETFDAARDCVRPWELAVVDAWLARVGEACGPCLAAEAAAGAPE